MADQFELNARVRARSGTSLVRRLRREGEVPAVLYGGNKDNISLAINHDVLFHSLEKEEFHSAIIVINTDGEKEQAILRSVQLHPHRSNILHADFQRVDESRELTMSLPIHFIGEDECVGVRIGGGVVSHLINDVQITCLPKDLPEQIELDISGLDLNESLHFTDIQLPEGVQITALMHDEDNEHNYAVVAVSPSRIGPDPEEEGDGAMDPGEEAERAAADDPAE
ncbi:MAG: 50S ribosomal protein L25/general stress protein Ctc [Gammaproteobacteria bacterium]|nr:50S ribosomal protein L25/general stress protein Ctc [Gammaproteobacteria bacterium]